MLKRNFSAIALAAFFLLLHTVKTDAQKIFPGATGFGTDSRGAYAGSSTPSVLYVNTLDGGNFSTSDTSGTLKWCLSRDYPRIILFMVGGIIDWKSNSEDYYAGHNNDFSVLNPYCNVYGQSAPWPGITITNGGMLFIDNHDILIQHIKIRVSDNENTWGKETSCIGGWSNNYNIVIDHCSFSWSIDQLLGFNPANNITISNNIFSEPLDHNTHPDPGDEYHGMFNTFMRTQKITITNNLYAHGQFRAPFFNSGIQDIYVANNMMYNIKYYGVVLQDEINMDSLTRMDVIGNYYKSGQNTTGLNELVLVQDNVDPQSSIHMNGNYSSITSSQSAMVENEANCNIQTSHSIVDSKGYIPLDVDSVPDYIYSNAGAFYWDRDQTDARIIQDVKNNTGHVIDSVSQLENTYLNISPTSHQLVVPADPHGDENENGYTNLEEWIYQITSSSPIETNHQPDIQNQTLSIADTLNAGTFIKKITASDPDNGQQLAYNILSGNTNDRYSIGASTGNLILGEDINISADETDHLVVQVMDNGYLNLTASATITVNIEYVALLQSNHYPEIHDQSFIVYSPGSKGFNIGTMTATDPDEGQLLTYSVLSSDNESLFSVNSSTGNIFLQEDISTIEITDYQLKIQVTDNSPEGLSDSAIAYITIYPDQKITYIDPDNNNAVKDGSFAYPFNSWSSVNWKEGYTYLQKTGTTASEGKINIESGNVVIGSYGEGAKPKISSSATDFAIRVFEKSNVTIKDLQIIAPDAISGIYILGASCDSNTVQNCILEGSDNGIRIIDGQTVTCKYNTFKNKADAIYSYSRKTVIYYNIFTGNQTSINITSNLSEADIYNNAFYDNREAITTSYASLTLYNNIFYLVNPGDMAIEHKMNKIISDYNIFYPEQEGFISISDNKYNSLYSYNKSLNIDMHSFSKDPMFIDIYSDNFGVLPQSPAIDAGTQVGLMQDYTGNSVPDGNAPDIGLFESSKLFSDLIFGFDDPPDEPIIFPNPSNGQFYVDLNNTGSGYYKLQISNIAGIQVFNLPISEFNFNIPVDISNQPGGVYILNFISANDVLSKTIIVQ